MTEAQFQSKFGRWLKNRWTGGAAAFELKVAGGERLPFSAVKPHQVLALRLSSANNLRLNSGLYYKIADVGQGRKPFDCFYMTGVAAYVVVMFNKNDIKQRDFYLIDIDTWIQEQDSESGPRSMTRERADEIGIKHTLGV